jgi:hypothetical protein
MYLNNFYSSMTNGYFFNHLLYTCHEYYRRWLPFLFGWRSAVVVAGLLAATDPLFRVRLVLSNCFHLFIVWGYLSSFSPLLYVRACSSVFVRGVSVLLGFLAVLVFHIRVLFCFIVTPVLGILFCSCDFFFTLKRVFSRILCSLRLTPHPFTRWALQYPIYRKKVQRLKV